MKTNRRTKQPSVYTHEGARATNINPLRQLERAILSCMLWEDTYYENGVDIAERIADLVPQVKPEEVSALAIEARTNMKLRHAPLWIVRAMAKSKRHLPFVRQTLKEIIQRADEPAEFLALYWKDGRQPVAKQVRLGLADAFPKFSEYQLAKYDRDGTVKLRDVLRIVHPKPENKAQSRLWDKVIKRTLKTPGTWENELSAGKDRKATWTNFLKEGKLGALALLRNLRNMREAGVKDDLIRQALQDLKPARVLPFRFITAARYAPQFEPELEDAMFKCLTEKPKLEGSTTLLVDVSGSMEANISSRSEISRIDAACGLAMLLRETCEKVSIATFSHNTVEVPARRGFALRDAIYNSQPHGSTYLGAAVDLINQNRPGDRLIVITDEQSHDVVGNPVGVGYMINVASYKNGVGYGAWTHIDGWSEAIVDYIAAYEAAGA